MAAVNTISGPVDSSELGRTLSHEHLTGGSAGMDRLPGFPAREEIIDRCMEALRIARGRGIDTIIDTTPWDLGRQVWLFEELAARKQDHGVNIICATGVYRWVPGIYFGLSADEIADLFIREITEGMEGSSIRAGIIKIAWDMEYRLTDGADIAPRALLEKTARAAARAAIATGVPITCHTLATDELGTPLLDLFAEEGVDLRAVTIGHSNDTTDLDYLTEIAERGAVIGLDRTGSADPAYLEPRAAVALELINLGYAEQVCLGHDKSPSSFWRGWNQPRQPECWTVIPDVEIPWLLANGATDEDIDWLMRGSIARQFEVASFMRRPASVDA